MSIYLFRKSCMGEERNWTSEPQSLEHEERDNLMAVDDAFFDQPNSAGEETLNAEDYDIFPVPKDNISRVQKFFEKQRTGGWGEELNWRGNTPEEMGKLRLHSKIAAGWRPELSRERAVAEAFSSM
eukprot:Gb_01168 [translate_table: standard]